MLIRKTQIITQISGILNHKYFLLIFLWAVLTVINMDKAFHIDDTFHLEASEWIKDNPTRPMSGFINWKNDPTPISSHNQPPLFFYLIAVVSGIFGTNEVPLHLFLSLFTFLGLFYFYKIAQTLLVKQINTLLLLFAFCPAFIINQNLMTDVPILALIMGAVYYLLKASNSGKLLNYSLAAFILGSGLLIKYSVLPLLVVLILVIFIRREYKYLIVLLIPITILCLWSYWNYVEFGSIHFLDRPKGEIHINRFWAFMACIGSISTFVISLAYGAFPVKAIKRIIFLSIGLFFISVILFVFDQLPEQQYTKWLNVIFVINGFFVYISLLILLDSEIKRQGFQLFLKSDNFVIFLFLGSLSAFIVLFAPFMATRHILLIIPFVLLFGHNLIDKATIKINRLSIITGISLGLLLGISDWKYADYYREMAAEIKLPVDRVVWTAGHWGWQWYSQKNGMKQYSTTQSEVKEGDWFVYPGDISRQEIAGNIELIVIDKKWKEADMLTFFSGNSFASMYSSSVKNPPWRLSENPIDTIFIFRVAALNADTSFLRKTMP